MATVHDEAVSIFKNLRLGVDLRQRRACYTRMVNVLRDLKPHDPEAHYPERRRQVFELARHISTLGILRAEHLKNDFATWTALISPMVSWDMAVLTRLVIHFQLFGGTLVELGTERHQKWVDMVNAGTVCGGFAMTEIGHGSNVQAIETRADYDAATQEFVLTSPTPSSTKFMIGNVGVHGDIVVLMAQLYVAGEKKGVHAFVVPLRTSMGGDLLPGVDLGDIGLKSSWNEVDNAWIRFRGMRIPRENLLNRLADVSPDGTYTSVMPTPGKLFSATMIQLLVGRINYVGAPLLGLQTALSTCIRYSLSRRQFSPGPGLPETVIMQYSTQYLYLMNTLAKTVALQISKSPIISRFYTDKNDPERLADYHATLSGFKAYICEWAYVQFGHLRVMLGGAGIMHSNGAGMLHNYFDVFQTAEGDRNVLYQQLGKHLVQTALKKFAGNFGLLNYAIEVLGQQLIQLNPILSLVEANTERDLTSPGFILKALDMRAKVTIRNVLAQLQNARTAPKPLSPAEAWNEALPNIIVACDAFIEHFIYQQVYHEIKQLDASPEIYPSLETDEDDIIDEDEPPKPAPPAKGPVDSTNRTLALKQVKECLHTVSAVAGLGFIKDDFGFYMRAGLFSAKRCDAIEKTWMTYCAKMRDNFIPLLLDSAEIIQEFTNAPQGSRDGDYVTQILKTVKPSQAKL